MSAQVPGAGEHRRCAVLGSPIEHSLSPILHRAAYARLGLGWSYDRVEVRRGELAGFLAGLDPSWRGLSVTMPLKDEILEVGTLDESAALTGSGNTVILDWEGAGHTVHNTDIDGFARPLAELGTTLDTAVIIGGGATARSAYAALIRLGITRITVCARTRSKVADWQPMFDISATTPEIVGSDEIPDADLVICTVPKGAADHLAATIAERARVVFDVVYDPWPTPLAEAAAARGRPVLSGLDMLAHQAVGQLRLMTGGEVPAEVLLSAGREALGSRSRL